MRLIPILIIFLTAILCGCGGGSTDSLPAPSDNPGIVNPPTADPDPTPVADLQITSPADGAVVGGKTPISTNAEAIEGAQTFKILVDGTAISDHAYCIWDTTQAANGPHEIQLEVQWSSAGSRESSQKIHVIVDNKVPVWGRQESKTTSSLCPPVSITGITPGVIDSRGEEPLEIYGSGFLSLLNDLGNIRIEFAPLNRKVTSLSAPYNVFSIESDNCITVMPPYQWGAFAAGFSYSVAIVEFEPNDDGGAMHCWVLGTYGDLVVTGDGSAPIVTGIQPNTVTTGWHDEPIVLDVLGWGFTPQQPPDKFEAFVSNRHYVLGEDLSKNSIANGRFAQTVEYIDSSHLRLTFPADWWYGLVAAPDYLVWVQFEDSSDPTHPLRAAALGNVLKLVDPPQLRAPTITTIASDVTEGVSPLTVHLTAEAVSNNQGGSITSYAWDFQDDGVNDSFEQNPSFTYVLPESVDSRLYRAALTVEDSFGCRAWGVVYIQVEREMGGSQPPSVSLSVDYGEGASPLTVHFTGMASSNNPNGYITDYQWDFDGDGLWDDFSNSPQRTFYALPDETKSYTVLLRVTDNFGATAATVTSVTVHGAISTWDPPMVDTITSTPSSPVATSTGVWVDFYVVAHSPNLGGSIVSYNWDFQNDGTWDSTTLLGQANWHYNQPAGNLMQEMFTVRVQVTDGRGYTATGYGFVTVQQATPPQVFLNYSRGAAYSGSLVVNFTASAYGSATVPVSSYQWDLDGDSYWDYSGHADAVHEYVVPSGESEHTWTITVQVTDDLGQFAQAQQLITVQGAPAPLNVTMSPSDVTGTSPLTGSFKLNYLSGGDTVTDVVWYIDGQTVQFGGQQLQYTFALASGQSSWQYVVKARVTSTSGSVVFPHVAVYVYSGQSSGGDDSNPDLPPINIAGGDTGGSYDGGVYNPGDGAPNNTIKQAFIDAYNRTNGAAGRPVVAVHRVGSGYMQELYEGAAGSSAIMIMDGQSQAAWIHGDIYHSYMNLGGPTSYLGYPMQDEAVGIASAVTGAQNAYTLCSGDGVANADIVYHKNGPHAYGVFVVRGVIFNAWRDQGYSGGALGLPISDQYLVGNDWKSDFEGGYLIYRTSQNRVDKVLNGISSPGGDGGAGGGIGSIPYSNIQGLFEQKRQALGATVIGNPIGGIHPSTDLAMTGDFYGGLKYYYQLFDGSGSGWNGVLVYNPDRMQVYYVHGGIFKTWWWVPDNTGIGYGGMGLELGLPTRDEYAGTGDNYRYSDFEGGFIRWDPATPDVAYPNFNGSLPPDQYGNLDDFISQWIYNEFGNIWADLFDDVEEAWNLGDITLQVSSSRLKLFLPKVGLLFDFFDWQTFTIRLSQSPPQNEIDFLNRISRVAAEKGDTVYSELLNARIGLAGRDEWKLVRLANDQYLLTRFVEYVKNNPGRGAEWIQNNVQ